MFYVEWLRVRNCLRGFAIVLGVLLLIACIVRIALGAEIARTESWVVSESNKPGARVTHVRQSDGSERTTIDDPSDGTHIVIIDRGWNGKSITISGPGVQSSDTHGVQIGSLGVHTVRSTVHGGTVNVETDLPVPWRDLFALAAFVGLVIGTILAGPLAKENTNHLELTWTKPISRSALALGLFGVDAVGILAAMAMTVIFAILCTALFEAPHLIADSTTLAVLALCVFDTFAWYALLTAASASLKRGLGAVLGLGWLAALILPGIAFGLVQADMPLFHVAGLVLSYIVLLDPIPYVHLSSGAVNDVTPQYGYMLGLLSSGPGVRALILLVLTVIYSALSLVQWRRLEA